MRGGGERARADDRSEWRRALYGAVWRPVRPAGALGDGVGGSMLWWEEGFCRLPAAGGRFVVRYDHRDTGRSVTSAPGRPQYSGADLVVDAVGVLDGYELVAAHVVGVARRVGRSRSCSRSAFPIASCRSSSSARLRRLARSAAFPRRRSALTASLPQLRWRAPYPPPLRVAQSGSKRGIPRVRLCRALVPDSNRRPSLPWNVARNGWQPVATNFACFVVSVGSRFASDCRRLQPRGSIRALSSAGT